MPSPRTSRVWFWALVAAALLYVALLSWWSPFTSDTYHHALTGMEHRFSLSLVWERCVASYMSWNPRIGEYLAFAVATAGKWLFILLNPFVQVCLALMMFYLASGRRVDPRSWPDVRLFGLALLLLFTCTARPGVTIYWLSGATNYSWEPPSGSVSCACTGDCWKIGKTGKKESLLKRVSGSGLA